MVSCLFSMCCSTSNSHPKVSCISYRCITHETKVTDRDLLMPYHEKAFFGSLKSPSEFAEVMAPASHRHMYTQKSDLKGGLPCSGQFTLHDLHLSGLAVNLLKGNTAENSDWKFPTPKFTINVGFVSLSKIAPSHSKQQTQLYDHPLGLNTAPLSHFETFSHIPLITVKAETQSFVRCHAIPCSAGAPASRNTARSIVHLIRTFNCFSHRQGYCFPNRIIKEKNLQDPSQHCSPSCVATWVMVRVDGQEEDAKG